jgi:peptidoglycan/LPS O-acetylase OafA/YrhL
VSGSKYRPEIDGLRAIAVASVVLYHAGFGPAAGFAGVDVFFVISGYLITWLLATEWRDTGHIDLVGFYARRVRRILPAAGVVIVATVALSSFLLPFPAQENVNRSAVASALFFANVFFLQNSGGYFDGPSGEMPLLHLWSLAVEEQFYLVWPLFLILMLRLRARASRAIMALSILASLMLAEGLIRTYPDMAFYQMPARFWELAFGGFVALGTREGGAKQYVAFCGLGLIGIGLAFEAKHFPGLGALPAVAGTAAALWVIHRNGDLGKLGAWLRVGPINFLGRISYSLYLWHWPLLALYRATSVGVDKSAALALCGVAIVLATLTYRYIETPCRKLSLSGRGIRPLAIGATASISLALIIALVNAEIPQQLPATTTSAAPSRPDPATAAENDHPPARYQCDISPVAPATHFPAAGCESVPGVTPTVAILGDSYASSWQPLAWSIAEKMHTSAINYSRSGCPIFLTRFDDGKPVRDATCHEFNLNVMERIGSFDTVVLATRWDARSLDVDKEGIRSTLEALSPKVRQIFLLGPSPVLRDQAPKCIRVNQLDACAITRKEFDHASAPTRALLKSLVAQYKNVEYVELGDFLCTVKECGVVKEGIVLYTDQSHVSFTAAKKFAADYTAKRKWSLQ